MEAASRSKDSPLKDSPVTGVQQVYQRIKRANTGTQSMEMGKSTNKMNKIGEKLGNRPMPVERVMGPTETTRKLWGPVIHSLKCETFIMNPAENLSLASSLNNFVVASR